MNNKEVGNKSENDLIDFLVKQGWWCHLFAYKVGGQPCDVVALRNDVPFLIDAKHCVEDVFWFKGIQSNQKTCFSLARSKGNNNVGFAIYFEKIKEFRWFSFEMLERMEKMNYRGVSWKFLQPLEKVMLGDK